MDERMAQAAGAIIEAGQQVNVWHSMPCGEYGGFCDNTPIDYCCEKVWTEVKGDCRVCTTVPGVHQNLSSTMQTLQAEAVA